MEPFRLIHLSDLHICAAGVGERLRAFFNQLGDVLPKSVSIDFHVAKQEDLESLTTQVSTLLNSHVSTEGRAAVCITGDITAFGDSESFEDAVRFVTHIRDINPKVKVIAVPGNHDVLGWQFKQLLAILTSSKSCQASIGRRLLLRGLKLKPVVDQLERILHDLRIAEGTNPLALFNDFLNRSGCVDGQDPIGTIGNTKIWCVPFRSVSLNPLWMNSGVADNKEFDKFRRRLTEIPKHEEPIIIALVHHNPLSSPHIVDPFLTNAYNSFPAGSAFMREMQDAGANVLLYGHQHVTSCCLVDFGLSEPGHLYVIGAASSTATTKAGFNVIDIESRYHGAVRQYETTAAHRFQPHTGQPLVFERQRIGDSITLAMRGEVRHYRYSKPAETDLLWDEQFKDKAKAVLVVGPRASTLELPARQHTLAHLLSSPGCEWVRILISDPGLYDLIRKLPDIDRDRLSKMWGKDYGWKNQSESVKRVFGSLRDFWCELEEDQRPRLQVKLAHTLLPVGAALRYEFSGHDSLLLRMHPVGLMSDIFPALLRLERRHDKAVFKFYEDYFEKLWDEAKEIDWSAELVK